MKFITEIPKTYLLFAVILLGASLRLYCLTCGTIWLDEGYTLLLAKNSWWTTFSLVAYDANPPLGSLFYSSWISLFGSSELAVELPSALFGTISIYLFYHLGKAAYSEKTALIAAFLLAGSTYHLHHSQQIRVYSLALCFLLLSATFLLRYVRTQEKRFLYLSLVFAVILFYCHYYAIFVLAAFGGWLVANAASNEKDPSKQSSIYLKNIALPLSLALLTIIPGLIILGHQYLHHTSFHWIPKPSFHYISSTFIVLANDSRIVLAIFFSSLLLYCRHKHLKDLSSPTILLLFWFLIPLLLPIVLSILSSSFFHPRYLIFCFPPLILLVANQLTTHQKFTVPLIAIVVLASIPSFASYYKRQENTAYRKQFYRSLSPLIDDRTTILHTSKFTYVESSHYLGFLPRAHFFPGIKTSNTFRYLIPYQPEVEKELKNISKTQEYVVCISKSVGEQQMCRDLEENGFTKILLTNKKKLHASQWRRTKPLVTKRDTDA